MAEAMMRTLVGGRSDLRLESAGLGAINGASPSDHAVEAMQQLKIDISQHRSRALDAARLEQADFVVVMSRQQLETIELLYPNTVEKTFLLREFDDQAREFEKDIPDPIGHPMETYIRCRDQIRAALPSLLAFIEETKSNVRRRMFSNAVASVATGKPRVAFAADHGGFELKNRLKEWLETAGYPCVDLGPYKLDSNDDYPDYAFALAHQIAAGAVEFGVLLCRSSIGIAIAANRVRGVRAAQVSSETEVRLSRQHNNANVLCLAADYIDVATAQHWVELWLNTPFEGGRHQRRIEKLDRDGGNALEQTDPEVFTAIQQERKRQQENLELIASENFTSPAVLEAMGSVLTNKYAEGYPGRRWYGGCEFVDIPERLAIDRAKRLFQADHANVQPHSGSQANMAVYFCTLNPGDTILTMDLAHGGHLTHGHKMNFSGKFYRVIHYGVRQDTETIDYDALAALAAEHKPKMITAGASAYSRIIDFARMGQIARQVDALLMVDMAHIAGLVAVGIHPSPVPHADFVTTTTHKTLRGPRGGLILCKAKYAKELDSVMFPGVQGGPLMHVIAAKAVCLQEAMEPSFQNYQRQIVANAKALAAQLAHHGYRIVSGGTDNHLMLVDLRPKNLTGKQAQEALDKAGITVNKNAIPFDTQSPFQAGGIRLGTPAITTRGMREPEMEKIADLISRVLSDLNNPQTLAAVRKEVLTITQKFPLPY